MKSGDKVDELNWGQGSSMAKDNTTSGRKGNGAAATLGPHSEIGRKLKQYYDELVTEEVPDRFTTLLRQLEESERGGGDKKDNA
jgi:hypothetical protein